MKGLKAPPVAYQIIAVTLLEVSTLVSISKQYPRRKNLLYCFLLAILCILS